MKNTGTGIPEKEKWRGKFLPVLLILSAWLLVNLIQAAFTGLFDDEALFWMYGQRLNWGYYEHPPMVGLMIRAGYEIFHNELGLRLFFVIGSTLSVYIMMRLAKVKDYLLFASLCFSVMIMHVGGFIAAPDGSLFLFILFFFLLYKKYLENDSPWLAILWGFVMAAMIYSKYNGILVILFTILSNPSLLKKRTFYLAAASAVFFFIPHIIWSLRLGFPTVYYHLVERTYTTYDMLKGFLEFIPGQILFYGPLVSLFIFWYTIRFKPSDLFERSLKFTALGVMAFFLLYTLHANVEANWTIPALLPMILLTYKSVEQNLRVRRIIFPLALVSMVIFLFLRIYLIHDFLGLPRKTFNLSELYGWDEWTREVKKRAEGRPVVILDSYQRASKYSFYSGETANCLDESDVHRTQFWYWKDLEQKVQGRPVFIAHFMPWINIPGGSSFTGRNGIITYYGKRDNFQSFYRVPVRVMKRDLDFPAGREVEIPVRIINPDQGILRFDKDSTQQSFLTYYICRDGAFIDPLHKTMEISKMVIPGESADTVIRLKTPDKPGDYFFWVSIQTGWLPPAKNDYIHIMKIR
jgi:4-amino-4-deoxy-L-arabinose transferase-like glycosyltransferase